MLHLKLTLTTQVVEYHSIESDENCAAVAKYHWEDLKLRGMLHPAAHLVQHVDFDDSTKFWQTAEGWGGQMSSAGVKRLDCVLLAGGSPCNNISGKNQKTRTGLSGEHSKLFFVFARAVRALMSLAKG